MGEAANFRAQWQVQWNGKAFISVNHLRNGVVTTVFPKETGRPRGFTAANETLLTWACASSSFMMKLS